MPEFHVENLPTEFLDHFAKHVADNGKCPLCVTAKKLMAENHFVKPKPIRWLIEKNLPQCIWALGKYIMAKHSIAPVAIDRHNRMTDKCYEGGNAKLEKILHQYTK